MNFNCFSLHRRCCLPVTVNAAASTFRHFRISSSPTNEPESPDFVPAARNARVPRVAAQVAAHRLEKMASEFLPSVSLQTPLIPESFRYKYATWLNPAVVLLFKYRIYFIVNGAFYFRVSIVTCCIITPIGNLTCTLIVMIFSESFAPYGNV